MKLIDYSCVSCMNTQIVAMPRKVIHLKLVPTALLAYASLES